ncbi:LuxR C-terminal-related transcriptional regulator [Marinobacter sp. G11]|uniref:LuxR C-terminal-related transcriptional regulator n=1 Tax=Marinobacter sp. G11 TaxID=2903522 RepID=UPI001E5A8D5E|nr:LuxR C-terminal-related transcriptional regulator [Marinobacter sp. G11]MCE0760780.1 LuxR C-terminal-related transcriptional regulator [Marinobacter sp. G11]
MRQQKSVHGIRRHLNSSWRLPLIPTKLSSPRRSQPLFYRKRLGSLAQSILKYAVISVQAPAGYGKTTLIGQWVDEYRGGDKLVAWLSLSEEDNSERQFLSYLIASLSIAKPNFCSEAVRAINSEPPLSIETVEAIFLSELAASREEILLTLDDYHCITNPEIHELMSRLIQNRPDNLHIIIATRSEVPLRLSRLKLENQLLSLDVSDLRMDFSELETFLGEVVELNLPKNVARLLYEVSEGWVAGVQMAALSPRLRREPTKFLNELASGSRDLRNYLDEVLIELLPSELEEALVRCSIFERFNASLCEVVAGVNDGSAFLEELSRLNLFIFSLDDDNQWFRFHRLFSDFLQERLDQLGAKEVRALHSLACNWFVAHELWAEAVSHALALGNSGLAKTFIERCASEMLEQSRTGTLVNWGKQIPEHELSKNIDLRLAIVRAQMLMMELPPIHGLLQEIESDLQNSDDVDLMERKEDLRTQLKTTSSLLALLEDRLEDARAAAEPLMKAPRALNRFEYEVVFNVLGYIYLHQMRFDELVELQQQAARMTKNLHFGEGYRKGFEGLSWFWRGRLERARAVLEESLAISEKIAGRRSMASVTAIASLAEICYERNEIEEAEELLASAMTGSLDACLLITAQTIYSLLARISKLRGEKSESWILLDKLEKIAMKRGWVRVEGHCYVERIQSDIWDGDGVSAAKELKRFEQYLDTVNLDAIAKGILYDDWLISKARIEHLSQPSKNFTGELHKRIAVLDGQGALYRSAKFRMLVALGEWRAGQTKKAKESLIPALELGQSQGMCRTFADELQGGQCLLKNIASSLETDEMRLRPYIEYLINSMEPAPKLLGIADKDLESDPSRADVSDLELLNASEVTGREREILELIGEGLFNKEVANLLGISEGTVKWHLKNLYSKLGVSSRTQALKRAQSLKLIN